MSREKIKYRVGIDDRPLTRAEFATALSRLLYGTKDSTNLYYTSHINKLYEK